MSKADDVFLKQFAGIIGLLVLFAITMYFIAGSIYRDEVIRISREGPSVATRITPVGQARVGDPSKVVAAEKKAAPAPAPVAVASADLTEVPAESEGKPGEATYNGACMACHMTGAAGAPKVDDKANWENRASQGLLGLLKNAIAGKGAMPARGGNPALTPADLANAIRFMLGKAGVEAK